MLKCQILPIIPLPPPTGVGGGTHALGGNLGFVPPRYSKGWGGNLKNPPLILGGERQICSPHCGGGTRFWCSPPTSGGDFGVPPHGEGGTSHPWGGLWGGSTPKFPPHCGGGEHAPPPTGEGVEGGIFLVSPPTMGGECAPLVSLNSRVRVRGFFSHQPGGRPQTELSFQGKYPK